eukprot:8980114-Pyramimonas_sp.AAC.1
MDGSEQSSTSRSAWPPANAVREARKAGTGGRKPLVVAARLRSLARAYSVETVEWTPSWP